MAASFDWLPGPNVLVLGAGASGLAAAEFLSTAGREVTVADARPEAELGNAPRLSRLGVRLRLLERPEELLAGMALVVASPGIPPSSPVLRTASRRGVPLWGEMELGYRALGEPGDRIVAVTGTKGKSSTVVLLASALERHGIKAEAVGNLGRPLTSLAGKLPPTSCILLEASSFQLASIERFRARIAVLLRITEDHLDWHPDRAHYHRSKSRILQNQKPGDWAVFDGADPVASHLVRSAVEETGASLLPFGERPGAGDPEVVLTGGRIVRRSRGSEELLADLSDIRMAGPHQEQNLAAAAAAASLLEVPRAPIEEAAAGFAGLPHALEELPPVSRVRFVNDSRATSLMATRAALRTFRDRGNPPVRLLLGGILKGGRFADLKPDLGSVVRIYAIGRSRDRIFRELAAFEPLPMDSLGEAVRRAFAEAAAGEVVLLSPGCSSFDSFRDYRDRGEQFRSLAAEMARPSGETP